MPIYLVDTDKGTVVDFDQFAQRLAEHATKIHDAVAARVAETGEDEDAALEALEANYTRALIEQDGHDLACEIAHKLTESDRHLDETTAAMIEGHLS